MFSGLIRDIAKVRSFTNNILWLDSNYKPEIGDSIAVNGACLSVIQKDSKGFSLEISAHSQSLIAMENYNGLVHIEPALRADSRFDGHFVQGHIDTIGVVKNIRTKANEVSIEISIPKEKLIYIIPKGSVCVDGVSLTISNVGESSFFLTIIPLTFKQTLFHTYKPNRRVNIETDVIVRSILHIMTHTNNQQPNPKSINSNSINNWALFDSIVMGY